MPFIVLVVTLSLAAATMCSASDTRTYEEARKSMQAGNYAEAYCILRPLAEQNDNRAQYLLGWMYHNGYGMAINDEEAKQWWTRSGNNGNRDALYQLALLLELDGRSGPDNALAYYLRAARLGHEDAGDWLRVRLATTMNDPAPELLDALEREWTLYGAPAKVKGDEANIRKGPGTGYPIVATLTRGTPLVELDRSGKWVRIGLAGRRQTGWIYAPLLENGFGK
ncbi:MAG: SH3 domain-containing protein [Gammaproteobacteria bacterium]|nr:SH3 domain-containing protein [Gammaproteobacteria bacterium]